MTPEIRQTALYFGSVLVGQALSFLLLPIVTHYLTASDYGEYALATAVSGLVAMFGSAWIRNVGMRFYYDALARGSSKAFYLTTAPLQVLLFLAIYVPTIYIVGSFELVTLTPRLWISAGLAMLMSDQFNYATSLLRAEQRATSFAVAEIGSGILRFAATVLGLLMGIRTAALLFDAASVGFAIGFVFALIALWRNLAGPAALDRQALGEILRTGPKSVPFSLSAWLERLADRLILQHFLGTTVVGIYSVAYTLGERILSSLVQAVFMMAWPNILAAWTEGEAPSARAAIRSAQWLYAWITVGPTVFLVAYGGALTRLLVAPEFHAAAGVVPIVAVAIWLGGLGTYLNRHFELSKRYGSLSTISLAGAGINVAVTWVLVPSYGMMGAAVGTLVNYLFNVAVFYFTRDPSLGSLNVPPFLAALSVSFAAWAISLLASGAHPIVAMGMFVGAYVIGGTVALRRKQLSEIAS